MSAFPPLTHVALTVRDLSVSVPWYEALFDAEPVMDEDTAGGSITPCTSSGRTP
jgi:glyoxylase I family protein